MKGLKEFRRSLNKDRTSGGKPSGSSQSSSAASPATFTGVKSAVSIQPPKLVIRAIKDYRSTAPQELSFHKGDFFHVTSETGGNPDWFEACNPITNARGLVPASFFDVLSKSGRAPTSAAGPGASSPQLGSGPMGMGMGMGPSLGSKQQPSTSVSSPYGRAQGAAVTAKGGGGLYAVVKYNFVAERDDELEAKAGEPIIVIAQSNFEWFVAKPIGRLGGPGLIPVTFVEIRDLVTGQPIEDVQELIESGVVPKVEEWKKMTAEYKKNTIPLGRFDFQQPTNQPVADSPFNATFGVGGAQQHQQQQQLHHHHHQQQEHHFYSGATRETSSPVPPPKDSFYGGASGGMTAASAEDVGAVGNELPPGMSPGEPLPTGIITSATVDSFHYEQGDYWFRIQASHVSGPSSSAPASAPKAPEGEERDLILYRLYEDFYEFQIALLDHFPAEAGREVDEGGHSSERILPLMPGPLDQVDDLITSQRRVDLDAYIVELCALPAYIMRSELVRLFFEPRPGDHCTTHPAPAAAGSENEASDLRYEEYGYVTRGMDDNSLQETVVQGNGTSKYSEDQPVGPTRSREDELVDRARKMSIGGNGASTAPRDSGRSSNTDSRSSGPSHLSQPNVMMRNTSATTVGSRGSNSSGGGGGAGGGHLRQASGSNPSLPQQPPPYHRIKVARRGDKENLCAIRMPPSPTLENLLEKVRDRLGNDLERLYYHEDRNDTIKTDRELNEWLEDAISHGWKLMLFAGT
ncbi:hypothetical protein IE53DRAFT_262904 [Violaceomyces palustris]|uniref:Uncharacterized protein n=1 Tax=Violaceomyces palustris TaxID=1673888 RepID=A0ACD0NMY8_9BASI|nr:hypothetical protein IE53DRAFT_262904 [Violaceomyces palustris]